MHLNEIITENILEAYENVSCLRADESVLSANEDIMQQPVYNSECEYQEKHQDQTLSQSSTQHQTSQKIHKKVKFSPAPVVTTCSTPAAPTASPWAGLFANGSTSAGTEDTSCSAINSKVAKYVTPSSSGVIAPTTPATATATSRATGVASANATATAPAKNCSVANAANGHPSCLKFAIFVLKSSYQNKNDDAAVSFTPRGLTNRSNYCYINSVLQALLSCSPLYNLMRAIPKKAANFCEDKAPTLNAMMSFMSKFPKLRLCSIKGGKGNRNDLSGNFRWDSAIEPTEIYKLWNASRGNHTAGQQEDAEEFLSYILNKLNDEFLEIIKLGSKINTEQNGENRQDETLAEEFGSTSLSDIFRGELRSRLHLDDEHSKDILQPFFTLQLNIKNASSIKECLERLTGRNQVEGITGSVCNEQEGAAWQQIHLAKLPPILILHLNCFDYRWNASRKILKKVEFPVELEIDEKILASTKYSKEQCAYRLFAVIYHDGRETSKGHYFTDVYNTVLSSWLRCNDSSVTPVSEKQVLMPQTPRVPYLLFYRRCDTISIAKQSQSNN